MSKQECFMCGAEPTHVEGLGPKSVCCECWGDCSHG